MGSGKSSILAVLLGELQPLLLPASPTFASATAPAAGRSKGHALPVSHSSASRAFPRMGSAGEEDVDLEDAPLLLHQV